MIRDRIDWSTLDPSRNREQWEARVLAIAACARENYRRRVTLVGQLWTWSRPLLAAAAVVALLGVASLSKLGRPERVTQIDPTMAMTVWAVSGEMPNTEAVMLVLGGTRVDP